MNHNKIFSNFPYQFNFSISTCSTGYLSCTRFSSSYVYGTSMINVVGCLFAQDTTKRNTIIVISFMQVFNTIHYQQPKVNHKYLTLNDYCVKMTL